MTDAAEYNKQLVRRIVDDMFNEGRLDEGDYVAMWNTATATHQGELFGVPPSGKQIQLKDFHFFRFYDGKIVEHWNQVSAGPAE
jgi:predicted ester cyclase